MVGGSIVIARERVARMLLPCGCPSQMDIDSGRGVSCSATRMPERPRTMAVEATTGCHAKQSSNQLKQSINLLGPSSHQLRQSSHRAIMHDGRGGDA
eukprot:6648168-Prymnesium_polylepis.1